MHVVFVDINYSSENAKCLDDKEIAIVPKSVQVIEDASEEVTNDSPQLIDRNSKNLDISTSDSQPQTE